MLPTSLRTLAVLALGLAARAQAPCSSWSDGFGRPGIPLTTVYTMRSWDDGQGEKLYAVGYTSGLGGLVLRRDGESWTTIHTSVNICAHIAAGVINGQPELYIGTRTQATTRIGRWDGTGLE